MAQWSHADRTIYTKIVYYGPAFGGKTTNLESLHRITDPQQENRLLAVKTSDDRTLFFDLLPFDLGDILGYQVAMKLYTVPGQVRYDATRQVVLAGADAVIFVADSNSGRAEQNRWSLQNLRMNMRAKRLDPATVPITYQFNKQDLPEAATPREVASWLGLGADDGVPAVATVDRGVLETFMASTNVMLQRLVGMADKRTRARIDTEQLMHHVDRAFAPHLARLSQIQVEQRDDAPTPELNEISIVPNSDDLLENSVQTSVKLGESLAVETARATRLEGEAEALRGLSESLRKVGASFDRDEIVDAALSAAAEILGAYAVSLIVNEDDRLALDRSWNELDDPLLVFEAGRPTLRRMVEAGQPCVVDDLAAEVGDQEASRRLYGLQSAVAVPVGPGNTRSLIAYGEQPDGSFSPRDVRFLATLAGHLSVGLEKARSHEELAHHRDRLEEMVSARTAELLKTYEELRQLDEMKDRFLGNLSHEMKTPLTAILSSAVFLHDYQGDAEQRAEMVETILSSAETSRRLLDDLFRVVGLESKSAPLVLAQATAEELAAAAIELSPTDTLPVRIEGSPEPLRVDLRRLARAIANMIDNALKFSSAADVELLLSTGQLSLGGRDLEGLAVSVLDRGPGVDPDAVERIFAPFEQGGDALTGKPAGVGIGLYEARTIARQHGGALEYAPREGGGSEFRLSIPLRTTPVPRGEETVDV